MKEKPAYGTWIRTHRILLFWAIALALASLSLFGLLQTWLCLLGLVSLPFFYIAFIITLTAYRFGPHGGNFQNRIHDLIVTRVATTGHFLDIGCGSGHLIIALAKRYPGQRCAGIDFWGNDWEYSRAQCELNARLEHVPDIEFLKASASDLPFADGRFDLVVSCLTFHEVQGVSSRGEILGEALRVVRPGGQFIFLDLFNDRRFYPDDAEIEKALAAGGATQMTMTPLSRCMLLPFPLDTGKALRHAVLIEGTRA